MNRFTIYCTDSQTKKILGLGAPIPACGYAPIIRYESAGYFVDKDKLLAYYIPTAEQMIGWLEEKGIFIEIKYYSHDRVYDSSIRRISNGNNIMGCLGFVKTRKEATLAAIDAALEYLSNNKK